MSATKTPTAEQQQAVAKFNTGRSLAIEAGAGAGKTSTLYLLAQEAAKRNQTVQYVAFNKAIVTEAGSKMPPNTNCRTAHSLAWGNVVKGTRYQQRLKNSARMRTSDIASRIGITDGIGITLQDGTYKKLSAGRLAGLAMRGVTGFCQSADREPDAKHVPYIDGIDLPPGARVNNEMVARSLVPAMRRAWKDIVDEHGSLPFKHEHYLKLWHLRGPKINADVILFDEAQDANPVLLDIVRQQTHAQLVWVGDSQQQIYSFTGAINALQAVGAEEESYLTQSFRFGPAIADVANVILRGLRAPFELTGTESIPSRVEYDAAPTAILSRTNATAVTGLLEAMKQGRKAHLVGGGQEVIAFAKGAQKLMTDGWTDHPELACFDSWNEVRHYVEQDEQGGDLRLMVKLIEEFGVVAIIDALESMPNEEEADSVFSTAHKAKGREWDTVKLADDFPTEAHGEELRLLYVAVTRARLGLDITACKMLTDEAVPTLDPDHGQDEQVLDDDVVAPYAPEELAETEADLVAAAMDTALNALIATGMTEELAVEALRQALDVQAEGIQQEKLGDPMQRRLDQLAAADVANEGRGPHTVAEHLAGVEGDYAIWRDGRLAGEETNSRTAIERASELYAQGGQRVTVMDETTGELVVEYDA